MAETPSESFLGEVRRLADQIAPPLNFAEACVQRTLLQQFAQRASCYLGDASRECADAAARIESVSDFRGWATHITWEQSLVAFARRDAPDSMRKIVAILRDEGARPYAGGSGLVTLAAAAARVGRNPSYVSACFRRTFGLTFTECLTRVRIAKAVRLLKAGTKPEAVGLLVGYRSKGQFYKVFHRLAGRTPGEFGRQAATPRITVDATAEGATRISNGHRAH